MNVHCKKSWKGNIDIRKHIVEKAINKNQSIIVTCDAFEGKSVQLLYK